MRASNVSKCLDKKLILFGFEVFDVLAIFIVLSVLNLLFGQSSMKLFLVWLPTIGLALTLRYGKRGKPDKHLIHLLRFQLKPGVLSAFKDPSVVIPPPRLKRNG